MVARLKEQSPAHYLRYLEPFVGSGALYFHLRPKSGILSDLNWDVINLFEQVRDNPVLLHQKLIDTSRDKETYLRIRSHFGDEEDLLERAVSMLYLNRNCFNGLFRTNKSGKFNVPYAAARRGQNPSLENIVDCAEQLKSTLVIHGDFYSVISEHVREGDFVYLDPPYVMSQGRIFNEYVKGHFNGADIERLSELLRLIDSRGGKFVMSFIEDEVISKIADEWGAGKYFVQRNISGFANKRRKSSELIIKN